MVMPYCIPIDPPDAESVSHRQAIVTSVGARLQAGIVLIPLTFGNRSDWARNVRAAGECSVRLNGTA
jgi:hypothetical protein